MKQVLAVLLSTFMFFPTLASDVYPEADLDRRYDMRSIEIRSETPIHVQIQASVLTRDGCNHFGLGGYFRKIEIPEGVTTVIQDVLADFAIYQTEMACSPLEQPRALDLRSSLLKVQPINGLIHLHVLLPENMRVLIYRNLEGVSE